jgi:hypothetical protein
LKVNHLESHNVKIEEEMGGKEQQLRMLEREISVKEKEKTELYEKV